MMAGRKPFVREIRDILILVTAGFALTWFGVSCTDCRENTRLFMVVGSFTALVWILLWKGNEYLGHFISTRISWIKFPLKRFVVGIIATVAYTLAAMYTLTIIYENTFGLDMGAGMSLSVVITIGISLFMHGREFLSNWRNAAILAEKYKKESIAARYESLKNQVNPHFLFNSLNALSNLVYEDEEKASVFIKELSDVYRYVIETQDRETVPLGDELKFLESYVYLQQIRFGDKLQVSVNLNGLSTEVAPLSLQMLIENAIKHNVIAEDEPLTIVVRSDDSFIVVENNLQKKRSMVDDSAGVGLENICRRYEMLSEEKVRIEETSSHFRVKLPLLNQITK